jgi:hypothetical protein
MRILFELKTEEFGRKRNIMWSSIIYIACQILGYQRTVAKWVRNVACMGVKVILNRFLIGKRGRKGSIQKVHEYGRIILKWILRNCIRMEFDYSCFRRALNDVLMNCVMNRKFHKIGEYLDKLSNHWHLRKYTRCV